MKKSVVVKGKKIQVEYKVYNWETINIKDRFDKRGEGIYDRDFNLYFILEGVSYIVFFNEIQYNGNCTRKFFVENQWVTSEKKMIEAILNK